MSTHTYDALDQRSADTMRCLAIDAVQAAKSGHPGLPLGAADMMYVLQHRGVQDVSDCEWVNRDRIVLSAGHGSALLYSTLHLASHGKHYSTDDLSKFRQWGSPTPGHPEHHTHRGIETTTGPLGQGFAQAVGLALAERIIAAKVNVDKEFPNVINHYTYVLCSDGDLMEGVSHEAASLAGTLKLGKLIVLYDDNNVCIDGEVTLACKDDALKRFDSYGWHAQRVNGHDMNEISKAIDVAQAETEKPSIICCKTIIGYKAPGAGTHKVHGAPLGDEGVIKTKEALKFPTDKKFYVEENVYKNFDDLQAKKTLVRKEWDAMFARFSVAHPDLAAYLKCIRTGEVEPGWEKAIPTFAPGTSMATRVASGKVLDEISSPNGPTALLSKLLIGGSADLTPSNNTLAKGVTDILPQNNYNGGYVHYGIREHAMGQALNGLALHGLRPFGGTFLVFSDYMRPTARASAMMGLPVVYVWTHDSIGLGEDGPTHQPIEHYTSLRCTPNLIVFRPCDANEVAGCWKYAIEQKRQRKPWACEGDHDPSAGMIHAPCALLLTRQNLPVLSPPASENRVARGAYVLSECEGKPEVLLLATGSEVAIAHQAQAALKKEGIPSKVISMPSWELFDAQPQDYKDSVLLPGVPRVTVEAGSTIAWPRYYGGMPGASIGLDRYGASAPAEVLFEKFEITSNNVVAVAKKLLKK